MAATALLPPLLPTPPRSGMLPILPTPPRSKMLPLLPTPCGGLTIPTASSSKPGRADSAERWDAHKKPCSSSTDSSVSPGRADSVERWDSKKISTTRFTSASPLVDRGRQDGRYKRLPSRASSAERWDLHKKPRPEETDDTAAKVTTTMVHKEMPMTTAVVHKEMLMAQQAIFAGSTFFASPEPCMLPMPTFSLKAH